MKINRDETIKKHFDLVVLLTNRLAEQKLSLLYHTYDYLCFGNWEIIVGTGHKERKCFWDGRDFFLTVSDRKIGNMTQGGKWNLVYELPVGEIRDEELFEKVYQLALETKLK